MKLLEDNIVVNLCEFWLGNSFLDVTSKHKQLKKKLNWTSSKLKTCVSRGHYHRSEKIIHEMEEKIYKSCI